MLKGKTALVTGSTSGIGLGIAKALARQGANIVLNGFGDVEGPKAEVAALGRHLMSEVGRLVPVLPVPDRVDFILQKLGMPKQRE